MSKTGITRRSFIRASVGAAAGLASLACGVGTDSSAGARSASSPTSRSSATSTVNVGTGTGIFTGLVEVQGIAALNQPEGWGIGHSALSMLNHDGQPIPMLASQLP